MSAPPREGTLATIGRFLEIQNLGLNLSFALAFLLLASHGLPTLEKFLLIVIAFVAARNAGHSFNRWTDRAQDARNPRTASRALVTGRISSAFALTIAIGSGAIVVAAAYFLNPLAFVLSPVALALVYGYSYTKRFTSATTAFLGLVEAITPAAIFIAVQGTLPWATWLAVAGMLAWGTAFETVHSLGDIENDRAQGLKSIPVRFGVPVSVRLVPTLHAIALVLLALFGLAQGVGFEYYVALAAMAVLTGISDVQLARAPQGTRVPFQRHFIAGLLYLTGTAAALFIL